MTEALTEYRTAVSLGVLVILFAWESLVPYFACFRNRTKDRLQHGAINVLLGVINAAFNATAAVALWYWACGWVSARSLGLLNWGELPPVGQWIAAFLLLDLWMYWWHRICHEVPMLWRFHRVHHSDPMMDVSTAYRFHFGEMAASAIVRVPVIALIGLSLEHIALFELVLFVLVQLQHANIGLSPPLDRLLRVVLVSPFMHKVHHSDQPRETDSNYCSLFSWCDRIFGTYRTRSDHRSIRFGLREFKQPEDQRLGALLSNPLQPRKTIASGDESVNSPGPKKKDT